MTGNAKGRGLVGRQHELSELEEMLSAVRDGQARLAIVEGPTGIGKTALVEQFLSQHDDLAVRWASGAPWESSVTFGVTGQLQRGSTDTAALPPPSEQTAEPVRAGLRLLETWQQAHTPIAVVVDDAQWADLPSLQALSSAFRRMLSERVLILLSLRMDEQDGASRQVQDFFSRHQGPMIRVGPLKPVDIQALASQHANVDLSASATQRLAEHTCGNPLHITQLLHELPARTGSSGSQHCPLPVRSPRTSGAGCVPATRRHVPSSNRRPCSARPLRSPQQRIWRVSKNRSPRWTRRAASGC